jgi:hypothetical protein
MVFMTAARFPVWLSAYAPMHSFELSFAHWVVSAVNSISIPIWKISAWSSTTGFHVTKPNFFRRAILQVVEKMVSAEGIEPSTY